MTWREDLRRVTLPDGRRLVGASFRGVPFFVESADRSGGRRTVMHEFPLRDDPFVEDLGRRARTFALESYVIGDDYLRQRDTLLSALEDRAGPGELVHPYYGTLRAICTRLTTKETTRDGGMARFSIEFEHTPAQPPTPTEAPDLPAQVSTSADAAASAVRAEFVATYDITSLPAFAIASAERALRSATTAVDAALAPVVRNTQELAQLAASIRLVTAQAAALVRRPDAVMDAFRNSFGSLFTSIVNAPGSVMRALFDAYGFDGGPPPLLTSATRRREAANHVALTAALRRLVAIEAARLAPRVPYRSIEEAASARDAVSAQLEEQSAIAGDAAYPALVQLRADVLRAVPSESVFARVVTVTRRVAVPSLLLAYQLYGSVEQESDIIARNRIAHPGFVSGELQVLSDV